MSECFLANCGKNGLSLVSCLFYDVSCIMSFVSCLLNHVSCLVYHVSWLMSHVFCLLSHASCLLSHVSCPVSPVSCLLSHVSCLKPSVSSLTSPVPCLLSPVSCLTSPVPRLLSHVSCLTSPVSSLTLYMTFAEGFYTDLIRVKGSVTRFSTFIFFHDSNPSRPLIKRLKYFRIRFRLKESQDTYPSRSIVHNLVILQYILGAHHL